MSRKTDNQALTEYLVESGYLESERVIQAFKDVDRADFTVDAGENAYLDRPISIGYGQTISAPHMVAIMTELLDVHPGHRVLDVGCGSGYQAAILSRLALPAGVTAVELVPELAEKAGKTFREKGFSNIDVIQGDGSMGLRDVLFDRIIVAAASPRIPGPLVGNLDEEGVLLIPVGDRRFQQLKAVRKIRGEVSVSSHGGCVFVPLKGEHGWG